MIADIKTNARQNTPRNVARVIFPESRVLRNRIDLIDRARVIQQQYGYYPTAVTMNPGIHKSDYGSASEIGMMKVILNERQMTIDFILPSEQS